MDRQFIINVHKELLLASAPLPTVAFFVDRKGASLANMDAISTDKDCKEVTPEICFSLGRHTAQERHWTINDINEIAFVATEKRGNKEFLVFAFCVSATFPPTFSEQLVEIRRGDNGNIALLTGEATPNLMHDKLYFFALGIASAPLSPTGMVMAMEIAKAMKEQGGEQWKRP